MLVANPIYDIVFKYLMEDERIARTILTAFGRHGFHYQAHDEQ